MIADGCRAVNVRPGDDRRAFDAMRAAGATVTDAEATLKQLAEPH